MIQKNAKAYKEKKRLLLDAIESQHNLIRCYIDDANDSDDISLLEAVYQALDSVITEKGITAKTEEIGE